MRKGKNRQSYKRERKTKAKQKECESEFNDREKYIKEED